MKSFKLKPKVHSEKWFAKQERLAAEPIKNTKRYYYRTSWIMIATIVLAIFGIPRLIKLHRNLNSYFSLSTDVLSNGRTITNDGAPGSGKTFAGSNMAYFLAQRRWDELKSDYFTAKSMRTQWVKEGNVDKLTALKSLEESYAFYAEREDKYIPCLVSTIPLREYETGRMSYVLSPEIYIQVKRCPEYSVLFNDESGLLFGGDTSNTNNNDLKDFWRFIRHMLDAMCVNTNQDGNQNGIYMRRSTDYVNHLQGQTWIMSPKRLINKYERMEQRYFKKLSKGKLSESKAIYIGQKLYFLKKYIKTIGFRQVKHRLTTVRGELIGDEGVYILPAIGGVEYDERSYRKLYKCKDQPIELNGWERLVVDELDREQYDKLINGEANANGGGY